MALLIGNQAAFVEQMARSDREFAEWRREFRASQWQNDERFARIHDRFAGVEKRLSRIETILIQLPDVIRQKDRLQNAQVIHRRWHITNERKCVAPDCHSFLLRLRFELCSGRD